jgi:hypothetical protein
MPKHARLATPLAAVVGLGLSAVGADVRAQCCPSGGVGSPQPPLTGLGQSLPQSPDLAAHPSWQVYAFARDGIRYLQVNDANGVVRAAAGHIDDLYWTMPLGNDVERVLTDGDVLPPGQSTVLYSGNGEEVILIESNGTQYWLFRKPAN